MKYYATIAVLLLTPMLYAQQLMETGGKAMPDE